MTYTSLAHIDAVAATAGRVASRPQHAPEERTSTDASLQHDQLVAPDDERGRHDEATLAGQRHVERLLRLRRDDGGDGRRHRYRPELSAREFGRFGRR